MTTLKIILEHAPSTKIKNGYNVEPKESGDTQLIPVNDPEEARIVFCKYVGSNGLSGYNLTERSGTVIDENGNPVGRVQFCGRFREHEEAAPQADLLAS